jgi:hypothetical protein
MIAITIFMRLASLLGRLKRAAVVDGSDNQVSCQIESKDFGCAGDDPRRPSAAAMPKTNAIDQ